MASIAVGPDSSRDFPDGDRYYHQLSKLSKLAQNPNRTIAAKDSRYIESRYELVPGVKTTEVPEVIVEIVDWIRKFAELIEEKKCRILFGTYLRGAGMVVPSPTPDTINRVIVNLGNPELFKLDPRVELVDDLIPRLIAEKTGKKVDMNLPPKELFIRENKWIEMGTITSANYKILVSRSTQYTIPASLSGSNSVTKPQPSMRSSPYKRITLVLDFISTNEAIVRISMAAQAIVKSLDISKLPELLKQQKQQITPVNRKDEHEIDETMSKINRNRQQ